jgi:hypothetical protein
VTFFAIGRVAAAKEDLEPRAAKRAGKLTRELCMAETDSRRSVLGQFRDSRTQDATSCVFHIVRKLLGKTRLVPRKKKAATPGNLSRYSVSVVRLNLCRIEWRFRRHINVLPSR